MWIQQIFWFADIIGGHTNYCRADSPMKFIKFLCLVVIISGCAGKTPFQEANLETEVIYQFTSSTLNSSLYVKFIPGDAGVNELLFKTANNAEQVRSLEPGAPGVYLQKIYAVTERGKVSFRYFEEGLFEELLRHHQYASSGGQQEKISMFRYRLDFRRAVKLP